MIVPKRRLLAGISLSLFLSVGILVVGLVVNENTTQEPIHAAWSWTDAACAPWSVAWLASGLAIACLSWFVVARLARPGDAKALATAIPRSMIRWLIADPPPERRRDDQREPQVPARHDRQNPLRTTPSMAVASRIARWVAVAAIAYWTVNFIGALGGSCVP